MTTLNILIVEDDADTRDNLRDILELDGHRIDEAATAAEALDREDWSAYATILLDRKLPDGTAADLLPRLRRLAPTSAVIVVTGHADVDGAIEALRQGAIDYLLKPIDPDELRARLGRIAEHRRLEEAHRESERFARSVLDSLGRAHRRPGPLGHDPGRQPGLARFRRGERGRGRERRRGGRLPPDLRPGHG